MASYVKFHKFVQDLCKGEHDFDADTFKIMLVLTAPVQTNSLRSDLTEIASGDGYTTGGNTTTMSTSLSTGTVKVTGTDPTTWTATAGTFANFRYAVLYNDTATTLTDPLISNWDYGATIDLGPAETFTVDLDGSAGVFTLV